MDPLDLPPAPADSATPNPDSSGGTATSGPRGRGPWIVVCAAALVAAAVAWSAGEAGLLRVAPAIGRYEVMGQVITDTTFETRRVARVYEAALTYGAFGATLGLALGLAGGLSRRSPRAAALAAVVGLVGGAAAGGVAALAVLALYYRWVGEAAGEILPALLMHCGIWIAAGAAAGLALGVGRGGRGGSLIRTGLGGALGAGVGAILYDFLGALALPTSGTTEPIAETWGARLLAFVLLALFAAWGALLAERSPPDGPAKA